MVIFINRVEINLLMFFWFYSNADRGPSSLPIITPHHEEEGTKEGNISSEFSSLSLTDAKSPETQDPISVSLSSTELVDPEDSIDLATVGGTAADETTSDSATIGKKDASEQITVSTKASEPSSNEAVEERKDKGQEKDLSIDFKTPPSSPFPPVDDEALTPTTRRRRRLPDSLTITRKSSKSISLEPITDKPGLDSQNIQDYFKTRLSRERSEVLMYVMWCSGLLPCTTPNELELAIFISNISLYLLEVQSPFQQQELSTSWGSSNLPLLPVLITNLDHISKITVIGAFDRNVLVELHDKSPLRSFVLFPPTQETSEQIIQQFKAALDAYGLHYHMVDAKETAQLKGSSGVVITNPDSTTLAKLRKQLVRNKAFTRLSNFIATHKSKNLVGSFEVELQTNISERAQRIQVAQQLVVNIVTADLLPFSTGRINLRPLNLILTSEHIFLCEEHFLFNHLFQSAAVKQSFPRFEMTSSWPIAAITGVQMCDKSQVLRSHSDIVYEFTISFKSGESGQNGEGEVEPCEAHWLLCVHNQAYLSRFLESLKRTWKSIHDRELPLVYTTLLLPQFHRYHRLATSTNLMLPSSLTPLKSPSGRHKPHPPLFIRSEALLHFSSLTHSKRLRCFKDHFALADFLKSDETIITVFLAHCQPPMDKKKEIEVCVIVSNYAVYLLSDKENIRIWLDAGGLSSFTRMSLLNPENNSDLQCFFRLWLNDLAKVRVGILNLSIRLSETKSENTVNIFTRNLHSTMSFMAALASILNLQDPTQDEQPSDFLSDYVDVTEDPQYGEDSSVAASINPTKHPVDFVLPTPQQMGELMIRLVEHTLAVLQSTSVKKCADSLQILNYQIMLLAEQVRHKDVEYLHYRPHLVLLTNYGVFLCSNSSSPEISPCPFSPSHLVIKREKWMRIDAIQHVRVVEEEQYGVLQVIVTARSDTGGVSSRCLVPQNTQLTNIFLHFLSLLWRERMGRQLPIHYM